MLLFSLACTGAPTDSGSWESGFTGVQEQRIGQMGPLTTVPSDPTNRWAEDPDAARFGQYVYFDTGFSQDGTVSCASCHDPAKGLSDGLALSEGIGTTGRSAPTVWNTAYNRWMFWDGRADSHWSQALGPMESPVEHGGNRNAYAHYVNDDPALKAAYEALFGELPELSDSHRFPLDARPIPDAADHPHNLAWEAMAPEDQAAITQVYVNLGKSIAAYERLLITPRAPLDDFVEALEAQDTEAMNASLSPEAQQGLALFVGDARCHHCHAGSTLTDLEFHNIGLGQRDWLEEVDVGRFDGSALVVASEFSGTSVWSDDIDAGGQKLDYLVQESSEQISAFKTPGLRNIAHSAPYMHGGHFETLDEVVTHYNELTEEPAVQGSHRDELLVELELSDEQVAALVTFLDEALTSSTDLAPALLEQPSTP